MKILFSSGTQNPSKSKIFFGLLELEEQGLLKRLNSSMFPVVYENCYYNRLFSSASYYNFLMHTNDEYVGVCSLSMESTDSKAYIFTFGIIPNMRGAGLGTFMLKTLESYLFGHLSCDYVSLHVHVSNEKAKHFYIKNGYTLDSIVHDYYADMPSPSAYLMSKKLRY